MRILTRATAAAVTVGSMALSGVAVAAPGQLDPTFSGDGRVPIAGMSVASDVAIDGKGRVLVLGRVGDSARVVRLTPKGAFDKSFGTNGVVTGALGTQVTVDSANRVYVSLESNNGPARVVRLLTAGSADPSWGGKDGDPPGLAEVDAANGNPQIASDLAVDGNGRLVMTISSSGADTDFLVARLDTDGDEDDTFDGNGVQGTDFGLVDAARAVAIGPNNMVVVAGRTEVAGEQRGAISVFTNTGADATAFTGDGFETFSNLPDFSDVAIGPRGSYLVNGAADDTTLAAIKPSGQLDTRFSVDGRIDLPEVPFCLLCRSSVSYDAARARIYWSYPYVPGGQTISRLKPNGTFDKTLTLRNPAGSLDGNSVAIDPRSGRLVGVAVSNSTAVVRFETWARCAGKVPTLVGGPGSNTLRGTPKSDVIVGGAGRDKLVGRAGKDQLCGGSGRDWLIGGPGKDTLLGGPGVDRLIQ
ncbi:MAG TPA: hypothetical protein VLI04_15635 [Nocardioidaceae bacterium]|nr:hypothetical protein [Nocardioidaceae bacterium]